MIKFNLFLIFILPSIINFSGLLNNPENLKSPNLKKAERLTEYITPMGFDINFVRSINSKPVFKNNYYSKIKGIKLKINKIEKHLGLKIFENAYVMPKTSVSYIVDFLDDFSYFGSLESLLTKTENDSSDEKNKHQETENGLEITIFF